jgi:hypothetical protein
MDDDGADYPQCTNSCPKIVGEDKDGNPIRCGKRCSQTATPAHEAYGTHYCAEHR